MKKQLNMFTYLGIVVSREGALEDEINEKIAKTERLYNIITCEVKERY